MPNAFIVKPHEPRLNKVKYDEYYIDRWFKDKVVKCGDGEEDFTIVKVVVEDKRSIKDTIAAQADDVGLENILKKFALTGDESILPESVVSNEQVADFTQMPQDLIEAQNLFNAQEAAFNSLPKDLVKGRTFAEFMANINQDEFAAWQAALKAKMTPEKEKEGE